ncbi:MAG TPA: hypothetical protein VF772_16360, partial [Terriglobales bacterium]
MRAPTPVYCGGREPVFLAALAFSAEIIAGNRLWCAPRVWLIAGVIAAIAGCVLYRCAPSLPFPFVILVLVLLGGCICRCLMQPKLK